MAPNGVSILVGPRGPVAGSVVWATTFRARGRGLIGRKHLLDDEALVIEPCRRVHTIGLRYPLDVVFCDRSLRVLHVESLPPGRLSRRVGKARLCIELAAGRAAACGIVAGAVLSFEETA